MSMQDASQDTQAPNVEVESVRFLQKPGAKVGTLSVVVGGVHYIWKCQRARMFTAVESGLEALKRGEET